MLVVLNNILIGTVGYHLLRNHSVGPILLPQLNKKTWNDKVAIEEMNWGPIAIVQYFQTLEISFDRVIFLVALERLERKIGDITVYQWLGQLPDEKQIQACIGDAATGVISIENLLVIGEFFKIWPKESIPKIGFFSWLSFKNSFLSGENLKRSGFLLHTHYVLCCKALESSSHLLLHCPFS